MTARIVKLMASESVEPMLGRLARHVADERQIADFLVDREVLSDIVLTVGLGYDGFRFSADLAAENDLHKLRDLLPRVMELLTHDANYSDVLVALGAPAMLACSPDQAAVDRAVGRHEAIVRGLDEIARAAPTPARKRPGRPAKTRDLRFVVGSVAHRWEMHTGHEFNPYWPNGKPGNPATKFVYDVVEFIAPDRLAELPEVTEKIRHDWKEGRRDDWFRVAS